MYYNKYYPSNVSIPPIEGEYAYYSKNIQKFVSDLFYCAEFYKFEQPNVTY